MYKNIVVVTIDNISVYITSCDYFSCAFFFVTIIYVVMYKRHVKVGKYMSFLSQNNKSLKSSHIVLLAVIYFFKKYLLKDMYALEF